MPRSTITYRLCLAVLIGLALTACVPKAQAVSVSSPTPQPTATAVLFTRSPSPTNTPSPTLTPSLIPSGTPTPVVTVIPTATSQPLVFPWVTVLPDQTLNVPILMYHHIGSTKGEDGRYYASPEQFEKQMQWLFDNGYQTITITELAAALREGGSLPTRPVVLTFDDGHSDLYLQAYPIMRKYGFIGVMYLISDNIKNKAGITVEQVQEMHAAGWEVASHSMTHANLRKSNADLRKEICTSRQELNKVLEIPIYSFSYPYGEADEYIKNFTRDCGYTSGVGVGPGNTHTLAHVYFLSRREVQGDFSLDIFIKLFGLPK